MNLYEQLNQEQKEAVNFIEGPLLVLAGAGTGKTRVVTCRIANLLEMGVPSSQILGVTFTNKAAAEMKERVRSLTNSSVLICTFHSLGARILRESIMPLGYKRDFTVYDEDDADKLLKSCLTEKFPEEKQPDIKTYKHLISRAKDALIKPEDTTSLHLRGEMSRTFPQIYKLYQEKLLEYNAVDFDDLLYLPARLFQEHADVLEQYQQRWSFLLVDEYQDTNAAQYALIKLLVSKSQNLFVVGDPDQSIYSWRGANIQNIMNFEKDFPGATVIRLEHNYRSRSNILEAANAVIGQNENRYEKKLWSELGAGEKIKYFTAHSEQAEADFVADRIRYHADTHKIPLNQMVVFYRTNAQSRIYEDRLPHWRLPYVIVGGISFYHRREIKDILAYLRIIHSGSDFISFQRTINTPKRGIGEATVEKIRDGASQEKMPIFEYCAALVDGGTLLHPIKLTGKQQKAIEDYVTVIRELRHIAKEKSIKELVMETILKTNYLTSLKEDQETADDRKENLDELISKAFEWETATPEPTLALFLEELALKTSLDEADTTQDRVNLMTIHNGKGLEFPVAFIVGLEENLFPHVGSRDEDEGFEEERRLCYVGMTRAKEYLYLTNSKFRVIWGTPRVQRPSRFIYEIPGKYLEVLKERKQPFQQHSMKRREDDEFMDEDFIDDIDQTKHVIDEFEAYTPGEAVYHQDFGIGIVKESYQGTAGLTYKILFNKDNREKIIIAKYARLSRV